MHSQLDIWIHGAPEKRSFNAEEILPKILAHYEEFKSLDKEIRILRDAMKKPWLWIGNVKSRFQFSLSHSGDLMVVAIIQDRKIGVDLEKMRDDLEFDSLVAEYFSEDERAIFKNLTASGIEKKRLEYFYQTWTTKEAISKATGLGLSSDFPGMDFSLWQIHTLEVKLGHMMTIAVEQGEPLEIRTFHG
jgi:4'-phosphopantetheinyl transferase